MANRKKGNFAVDHFVQGILTVEDEIYLGEPDIRLANGEKIHTLFVDLRPDAETAEEENPVSALLEVDQWYELLLIIQIGVGRKKVTYLPSVPPGTRWELQPREYQSSSKVFTSNRVLQGIVLDMNWDAASQHYLAVVGPMVYTNHFVLVDTPIGKMVLSYKALEERLGGQIEQVVPGGYLEWDPSRLDILAIVAKGTPESGD